MPSIALALAVALALALAAPAEAASRIPVTERSVAQLQADMAAGRTTAVALMQAYAARIHALDAHGPALHSVLALNPHALEDARRLDRERGQGHVRGPLHGVPVLLKDNIESADDTATTAGSLALAGNVAAHDAPLVVRLKAAGAVVLGKTNLSEWANIRSTRSISGWSAVGGLVKNPYALDRTACGSSSGTGAAVAASLSAAGVGTETDGSVTCPAAMNGLVGLKPTVGLVSRSRIVPISHSQDTAGPMGRSVADVAALLTALAGSDPTDPATAQADAHRTDYLAGLTGASLQGKRLGVLRYACDVPPEALVRFDAALAILRAAGAEIVEIADYKPPKALGDEELTVLLTELKVDLDAYLATTDPARVPTRTLADVIAFDARTPRETALFGQELFVQAQATKGLEDPAYRAARAASLAAAGRDGIDRLLTANRLDALNAPTAGPAWPSDAVLGDAGGGGPGPGALPAIAGYPHLTVPMGQVRGLPVGLSFIGPAWSEQALLRLGAAFEASAPARAAPTYAASVETAPATAPLLAPTTPR